MTLRQVTALGLRLLGLYILVDLLIRIPQIMIFVLVYVHEGGGGFPAVTPGQIVVLTIFGFTCKTVLALVLVVRCRQIARWVTIDPDEDDLVPVVAGDNLLRSGIVVAGLVLAALNVAGLLDTFVQWRAVGTLIWIREPQPVDLQARALAQGLALLLGGLMVRHAAWLVDSVTAAGETDTG